MSLEDLRKKYTNQFRKDAQKQFDELQKKNQTSTDAYVDSVNKSYDAAATSMKSQTNQSIAALPQQYQRLYDTNELNRLIGERQAAETMANMGLTDSGLNRTQLAALQTAQNNADAALTQQKSAAARSLEQQLNNYLAQIEQEKAQSAASAALNLQNQNNALWQNLYSNAESRADAYAQTDYNAEISRKNYQDQLKAAQYAAQQKQLEAQRAAQDQYNLIVYDAEQKMKGGSLDDGTAYVYRQVMLGNITMEEAERIADYLYSLNKQNQKADAKAASEATAAKSWFDSNAFHAHRKKAQQF